MDLYTKTIELSPIVYKDPDLKKKKKDSSSKSGLVLKPIATKDPRIGTLDLETFNDILPNGEILARVYALGFATENQTKMYYLTDHFSNTTEGSNRLVLKCIEDIFQSIESMDGYTFYVHNLGKFDAIFRHKILIDFNSQVNDIAEEYGIKPMYRDGQIIKLEISKYVNKKVIKIKLVDSLNILNNSLDRLCSDFGLNTKKGIFPYKFVNKKNLNYIGPTPDIKFYNKNVNLDLYNENKKHNWSLKEESLNYLKLDLQSLLEVILKFQEILWEDHKIELTKGLTIASLAKTKFLKYYLKKSLIPLINNNNLFQFIFGGYFGGNTEVYKPLAHFWTYLDVNSLYPFAALNPMPGLVCKWVESYNSEGLDLDSLFGIFHARV
uniref:Probable DNA polymerase n=1 Tax=Termitomyces sp. TaxID=1916073 RepID=A0A386TYJ2_9AGAR|nr:DNA polymerase [Termitomyces sp.]